jgi:hypothetical protein
MPTGDRNEANHSIVARKCPSHSHLTEPAATFAHRHGRFAIQKACGRVGTISPLPVSHVNSNCMNYRFSLEAVAPGNGKLPIRWVHCRQCPRSDSSARIPDQRVQFARCRDITEPQSFSGHQGLVRKCDRTCFHIKPHARWVANERCLH